VKDVAKTLETETQEIKDNLNKELEKHDAEEGQKIS
jgi:hypothetical protein